MNGSGSPATMRFEFMGYCQSIVERLFIILIHTTQPHNHTTTQPWKIGYVVHRQYVDVNSLRIPFPVHSQQFFLCVVCVCVPSPWFRYSRMCHFTSTFTHRIHRFDARYMKSENNRTDLFYAMDCV